jgi:hypothetical protein
VIIIPFNRWDIARGINLGKEINHLGRPRLPESGAASAGFPSNPWFWWWSICCACLPSTVPAALPASACGLSKSQETFVHRSSCQTIINSRLSGKLQCGTYEITNTRLISEGKEKKYSKERNVQFVELIDRVAITVNATRNAKERRNNAERRGRVKEDNPCVKWIYVSVKMQKRFTQFTNVHNRCI